MPSTIAASSPPGKAYATIPQTCERYGVGRSSLYREIGRGNIRAVKMGRRVLVEIASADAFFAALPPANIRRDARDRRSAATKSEASV
jgi:excisionase family DNA binding protein